MFWNNDSLYSVDRECPLLSPSNTTRLANAAVFYSCSLHDEAFIPAELKSTDFSTVQEMVEKERAIPEMKTPGGWSDSYHIGWIFKCNLVHPKHFDED